MPDSTLKNNEGGAAAKSQEALTQACPGCGTEIAPALLSCPVCHRLVHAESLNRLAGEARQATERNDLAAALRLWREALDLLPPDSRQAETISRKVAALSAQVDAGGGPVAPTGSGSHVPSWAKKAGPVGAAALFAWKFKFIAAFLTKGKLLLAGLTQMHTLTTMAASLAVYGAAWGWKFAAGLVVSIYIHEIGHVAALRRFGIEATAPMFIPGFGAMIRSKHRPSGPSEDARVGLAGPIWGLGAALAAYVVFLATGSALWAAIARAGAWINLFNLLPIWPLDGGRGFRALTRQHRWILAALFGVLWYGTREGLLILLAIVAVVRAMPRAEINEPDRTTVAQYLVLAVTLSLMSQIPLPPPR